MPTPPSSDDARDDASDGASGDGPLRSERLELLHRVERALDAPMVVLGFVWLGLLVAELVGRIAPLLETLGTAIWGVFVLNFALEFGLAPDKGAYLRRNWLTAVSLVLPAARAFRVFRLLRAARGLRLVRVLGSLNRGMRALGGAMRRRGFAYVVALTALATVAGAAGMLAFEREAGGALDTYGEALWWTAMLMTTLGSEHWPQSAEGRALCFALALYAFAVFGYVTATLATYFVGRDAADATAEVAGARSVDALTAEVAALRAEIRALAARTGPP